MKKLHYVFCTAYTRLLNRSLEEMYSYFNLHMIVTKHLSGYRSVEHLYAVIVSVLHD